jgi:hypothetical protein
MRLLSDYLACGGRILALGNTPSRVDGRLSNEPAVLRERYLDQWLVFPDIASLLVDLKKHISPYLSAAEGALPESLVWRRVELPEGGRLYFFCNPWSEPLSAEIFLECSNFYELDTANGAIRAMNTDGRARLNLPPRGHALWLCLPAPLSEETCPVRVQTSRPSSNVKARFHLDGDRVQIKRLSPNLLFLDYCDLEAAGRVRLDVNTIHADGANWRAQGFPQNPWRQANQFKRTILERPIPASSGFTVRYRFHVDADLPFTNRAGLQVGVERPWLYQMRLNGQPVSQHQAAPWLDEEMRAIPIADYIQSGENVLELNASPFQVLCEIMPVYLLGDFALHQAERGFILAAPHPLTLGDWTQQGLPFYAGKVRYEFSFTLPTAQDAVHVQLGEWHGAAVVVHVDGQEMDVILHPPYCLALRVAFAAGVHTLALDVIGNMKNMFGPHFCDGLPGSWSWEDCPPHQPRGERYRLYPSGLFQPPKVQA